MTSFVDVLILVVWLFGVMGLGMVAIMQCLDGDRRIGAIAGVAAVVLFAAGVAIAEGSREPNRLCMRGHQEWVRTSGVIVVGGKVVVPTTGIGKQWVCEAWEAQGQKEN